MSGGRKPDFAVKVGLRGDKYHRKIGAAWKHDKGGIYIKLDPGIALVSANDVVISLWPDDKPPQERTPFD